MEKTKSCQHRFVEKWLMDVFQVNANAEYGVLSIVYSSQEISLVAFWVGSTEVSRNEVQFLVLLAVVLMEIGVGCFCRNNDVSL